MTKTFWLGTCLALALLTGCGGGETQANGGVGTGGTGSYSAGTITSFGSIVVNGIHYDPAQAAIRHVDEPTQALTPGALKLGMVIEVNGSAVQTRQGLQVAEAQTIKITSQLVGLVGQISGSQIRMLGQTVQVSSSTHYDDALPLGLNSLGPGQQVEVYGFFDAATDTYRASRIDLKNTPLTYHVVEGVVSDLDTANRTCRIGAQFYQLPTIPAGVVEGKVARVQILPGYNGASGMNPNNAVPASAIQATPPEVQDGRKTAYIDGLVTRVADGTGRLFSVGNVDVDARGIVCLLCASLQPGDHVRVNGSLNEATVTAAQVLAGTP
ncbi:MAG: hypothetical protein C0487_12180 [Leptothrix sp. (in: Bacteria)]|nr:hypothetical protein [Leptothrix sp. (in: b-proteobacteria)]